MIKIVGVRFRTAGKIYYFDPKKLPIKKGKKLKTVGKQALKGINKHAVVRVPKAKKNAYKALFKGKGQKKSVKVK